MLRVVFLHPVPVLLFLALGDRGKEFVLVAFRRSSIPVHEGLSPKDEDPLVGAVVRHRCRRIPCNTARCLMSSGDSHRNRLESRVGLYKTLAPSRPPENRNFSVATLPPVKPTAQDVLWPGFAGPGTMCL
eukprot:9203584-Pyramimonas_sp.AAC.1